MLNDNEVILKCRCADCETSKKRGCNSSILKELLGSLFDEEVSYENAQFLFCQHTPARAATVWVIEENECLCVECELRRGNGKHYCKSPDIVIDKMQTD